MDARSAYLPMVEGNAISVFQIATKNIKRAAYGEMDATGAGFAHCFEVGEGIGAAGVGDGEG